MPHMPPAGMPPWAQPQPPVWAQDSPPPLGLPPAAKVENCFSSFLLPQAGQSG